MLALRLFTYAVAGFMLLPLIVTGLLAFTAGGTVAFPPAGYSPRWMIALVQDSYLLIAGLRSLLLALAATVLSLAIALPCAFAVERWLPRRRTLAETAILSPRMVPEIVLVVALLIYVERIHIAETFGALLLSHLVIGVPFAFRTLSGSVAALDRRLEWSSDILGAPPQRRWFRVVLPQLKTALVSAFAFCFILSFNNVTFALLLSAAGKRTLPVEMFIRMNIGGMTPVVPALSLVLALIGALVYAALDRTIGAFSRLSGR